VDGQAFVAAIADRRVATSRRTQPDPAPVEGLRFAFYGRMSTSGYQDAVTSRAWQRAVCDELVDGVGAVVAEFFDEGVSRRWSWSQRPAAAALLAAAEAEDREFDAVVVGEYERAFYADQFRDVLTCLAAVGVQVWLPEAGGPVELDSPVHQALMVLLGAQAQREVARARQRVVAAMSAQARWQGRFLGGRPPYGFRLADAGPHPNRVHAGWGRRLHVLEPDLDTAPWVAWMFAERAAGRSIASITRKLNDRDIPCPSARDRSRNAHRAGERWIVRTVATILENPRYTGWQVWNRHATPGHPTRPHPATADGNAHQRAGGRDSGPCGGREGGRGAGVGRWNPVEDWIVSEQPAHPALVDEDTFLAAQRIRAIRPDAAGRSRSYRLTGLVVCGACGRRMDAAWVHGRAAYRCRHGYTTGTPRRAGPSNTYRREDHLLDAVPHLIRPAGLPRDRATIMNTGAAPAVSLPGGDRLDHQLDDLVGMLRARQLVIVCDTSGVHLAPSTADHVAASRNESTLDSSSQADSHSENRDRELKARRSLPKDRARRLKERPQLALIPG
jgi:DNA invertase Pin-like site-specific DNA recombinase